MTPAPGNNPENNKYDVIVIGAGHNGLTTAAMLAKSGRKVVVLERRLIVGGLAAREEFHPGFYTDGILHDASLFDEKVIRELGLSYHGLTMTDCPPPIFAPQREGPGLLLHHDPVLAKSEIEKHSAGDATRYVEYRAFLDRVRPFFNRLLRSIPPDVAAGGWRDQLALASTGLTLRRLGRKDMMEVLRIGPMCVADWLNEWFETQLLSCLLAGPALTCSSTGPWSPATNAMLLRHEMLSGRTATGGSSSITDALRVSCEQLGIDLHTNATVKEVRITGGVIEGVTLQDSESFDAPIVAASCDPKTLFCSLIDGRHIPARLEDRMTHLRTLGTTVKVHLALGKPLRFACRPDLEIQHARIAESFDEMERAFDSTKYRHCATSPILDIAIPSISNPTLAPKDHHVVSILAHFAPYDLDGSWGNDARESFGDLVVNRLASYAVDLNDAIIAREVLTPLDIETRYGLTGGHLHHAEHGLDQMITRPVPECARYGTPIRGLYLCGSGSHPGGGITGLPGSLAAKTIIKAG